MSLWPVNQLLPHAGDMILIDEVIRFDEKSVEARLQVTPGGLFNQDDNSLPAWLGVELMAQTIAAYAGCHARQDCRPVQLGFLLGTRNYECNVDRFPVDSELRIQVERAMQDENGMAIFECRLSGPGIEANARLNVFQPTEVNSFLQEPQP